MGVYHATLRLETEGNRLKSCTVLMARDHDQTHVMLMNSGYLNDGREILQYASIDTAFDTYSHVAPRFRRPSFRRLSRC